VLARSIAESLGMELVSAGSWAIVLAMDEHRDALDRAALALAAEAPLTVALVALRLELSVREARELLDGLVRAEALELDSFDDGTQCYRAPGLAHVDRAALVPIPRERTGISRVRSAGTRQAVAVFVGLSVIDFVGCGLAALIVMPHWEAEVLMWIALAGAPGVLVLVIRSILRATRTAP
jgi:hypothetical protein